PKLSCISACGLETENTSANRPAANIRINVAIDRRVSLRLDKVQGFRRYKDLTVAVLENVQIVNQTVLGQLGELRHKLSHSQAGYDEIDFSSRIFASQELCQIVLIGAIGKPRYVEIFIVDFNGAMIVIAKCRANAPIGKRVSRTSVVGFGVEPDNELGFVLVL